MYNKFLWHNFSYESDLERMGDSILDSIKSEGKSGSKSPTNSRRKGAAAATTAEPSNSKIKAANEGAVGGKRDKCVKGKSCSATCIYFNDECLVGLSETMSKEVKQATEFLGNLRTLRESLAGQVGKGISEDEAATIFEKHLGVQDELKFGPRNELIQLNEKTGKWTVNPQLKTKLPAIKKDVEEMNSALEAIRKKYPPDKAEARIQDIIGIMVPTTVTREREKISYTPPEALEYIRRNQKTFEKMDEVYKELKELHSKGQLTPEIANAKMSEISKALKTREGEWDEDDIRLAAAFLTPLERNFLGTAGSLKEGGGLFRKGDELPSEYGDLSAANKEQQRARLLLGVRNILETNGKNIYTGQPIHVLESDWEHMIPFEAIGKNAEVFSNIGLVTSRENGGKADRPPSWLYSTDKGGFMAGMEFDSNGVLTPASRAKWIAKEESKLAVKELKRSAFETGYYQEGPARLRSMQELLASSLLSKMSSDEKLQVMNKLALGVFLQFNPNFAETAGGAIQSHGRGDKRWYYFGKENPEFARFVVNRILYFEEKGDSEAINKMGEIMTNTINRRLNSEILRTIEPNFTYKGEPAVKLGDETTGQVRAVLDRLSKEAMALIEELG